MNEDVLSSSVGEGRRAGRTTALLRHSIRLFALGHNVSFVSVTKHVSQYMHATAVSLLKTERPDVSFDSDLPDMIKHETKGNRIRFDTLESSLRRRGRSIEVMMPDHAAFEFLEREREILQDRVAELLEGKRKADEEVVRLRDALRMQTEEMRDRLREVIDEEINRIQRG